MWWEDELIRQADEPNTPALTLLTLHRVDSGSDEVGIVHVNIGELG